MRNVVVTISAILLILLLAAPANASPSLPVTIDLAQVLDENHQGFVPSPFVATGPAVDAGLICRQGMAHNLTETVSGPFDLRNQYLEIHHFTKLFVCDDGSGSFLIKAEMRLLVTSEGWDQTAS